MKAIYRRYLKQGEKHFEIPPRERRNSEKDRKKEQINTFKRVAENLDKFQGLNNNFAKILIKKDQGKSVIEHLESFENLNYEEIAILLIQEKQ